MKVILTMFLLILVGCAQHRSPASSLNSINPVAQDSLALGNIKASAIKTIENGNVCFEIHLTLKGVQQKDASPSNWTVAWTDKKSHYHLLSFNQRDPASVPIGEKHVSAYGAYEEWSNTFKTCTSINRSEEVTSLTLTPKSLPFKTDKSLILIWK
jgi:hypothetical protein